MSGPTSVWASNSFSETKIWAPIRIMPSDRAQFDLNPDEASRWASVAKDYREALIKDGDVLPNVLTGQKLDTRVNKISDFFVGASFFVVSQRLADVFLKFDLGYGTGATHEISCRFCTGLLGYPARSLSM